MYSLYRAWLSLGPCPVPSLPSPTPPPPPPPLSLAAPTATGAPDVALQVGPGMTQFSAHRAVLAAHSGFFKAALLNHTEQTPIVVPNINVDEFSSLLTFMYTGYLDLNLSNIYNILLATHILHMPRALEICRSFLLHSQAAAPPPPLESRPSIIKPIASRKAATTLTPQQFYAPAFSNLQKSEATPFKAVNARPPPAPDKMRDVVNHQASTSKTEDKGGGSDLRSKTPNNAERKPEKSSHKHKKRSGSAGVSGSGGGDDKVIIDIACCDGPVRFHRVINKNYGHQQNQAENVYQMGEINRNAAMNKAMNENIRDQRGADENLGQGQNSDMFTCLYCNHTFKSQYCYQKHARRHLNPVSLEAKMAKESTGNKREVKLLDMNVQYYPCKTCGSKFPSYYFVHKHRKMCHAEEMAGDNSSNNDKEESVAAAATGASAPDRDTISDSGSAIDVEAINGEG